jgi:hypothetical protein
MNKNKFSFFIKNKIINYTPRKKYYFNTKKKEEKKPSYYYNYCYYLNRKNILILFLY